MNKTLKPTSRAGHSLATDAPSHSEIERARLRLSRNTDAKKKSRLGQFLTPQRTATFMAGLFPPSNGDCLLLDAGAGIGSLSAAVVEPDAFGDASMLGFENHLTVFHQGKRGQPKELAHGLAVFLNTSAVDEAFRRFNGHTQVNATVLTLMKYPSLAVLTTLGEWATQHKTLSQQMIDEKFGAVNV